MSFSGDVGVLPEPGAGACDGGSGSPEMATEEERRRAVAQPQSQMTTSDHREAAASEQAAERSAPEEEKLPAAEEEEEAAGDGQQDSARERLRRHRREMAGRVWVPEMWGQEKLLKDWVDCSAFDRPLVPAGLLTARRALVADRVLRAPPSAGAASRIKPSPGAKRLLLSELQV